jgi:hypothetical protein
VTSVDLSGLVPAVPGGAAGANKGNGTGTPTVPPVPIPPLPIPLPTLPGLPGGGGSGGGGGIPLPSLNPGGIGLLSYSYSAADAWLADYGAWGNA